MQPAFLVLTAALLALDYTAGSAGRQERPVNDATPPQVLREVKPAYTDSAKRERIQGNVMLEAVVKEDGTVGDVRVVKSLDTRHGLDEEAVKAMKEWRFKPGSKEGKAVAVAVQVEMTFTLK